MIEHGKELPIIQSFIQDVKTVAEKLAIGEDIDESLGSRLKLVYPPEVKEVLVKQHNEMSAKFTPSG